MSVIFVQLTILDPAHNFCTRPPIFVRKLPYCGSPIAPNL